jgi:hypothetical protein
MSFTRVRLIFLAYKRHGIKAIKVDIEWDEWKCNFKKKTSGFGEAVFDNSEINNINNLKPHYCK